MSEDEKQNNKDSVLHINVNDEIKVSDDVTIEVSDITVAARGENDEELKFVFGQAVSSDLIAQSVSDTLNIPADESDSFKEIITEKIEYIKKEPSKGKFGIELPLQKLCSGWSNFKITLIEFETGQKTTIRKYTTKSQQPKDT